MGKVVRFPESTSKRIEHKEKCAGCGIDLQGKEHVEIRMQHDDHVEVIALCKECHDEAERHGVQFN